MSVHIVKLPDVGEGIAEAELVEWHVSVGDPVTPDSVLAEVLTDKATVEISSPVAGTVTFIAGSPGDVLAIGSDLVGIELGVGAEPSAERAGPPPSVPAVAPAEIPAVAPAATPVAEELAAPSRPRPARPVADRPVERPVAAPVVRQRAKDLGVDLRLVRGRGPAGRITHADLDEFVRGDQPGLPRRPARDTSTREMAIVGLRRKIADKVSLSASRIPHITYVDEVDVTALEALRRALNDGSSAEEPKLTMLPFVMRAIIQAVAEQPHFNSTFDDSAGMLTTHAAVHIGIATQTPQGLIVPVVRHAVSSRSVPWGSSHQRPWVRAFARGRRRHVPVRRQIGSRPRATRGRRTSPVFGGSPGFGSTRCSTAAASCAASGSRLD